jgi:hypothetical protein
MPLLVEVLFWLFCFVLTIGVIFVNIMSLILCRDLEMDYVNPVEFCENMNKLVVPEYVAHAFLCSLLFVSGHWKAALSNAPVVYFNTRRWLDRRHLFESTSVFNTLPLTRRHSQLKLGFFALNFFYLLYSFVYFLINVSTQGSKLGPDIRFDIAPGTTV